MAVLLPACPFSTSVTPGISHHPHSGGEPCTVYLVYSGVLRCIKLPFFSRIKNFSLPAADLFSRSRLRGTQGTRLLMVQVWVPPGFRDGVQSREIWQVRLSDKLEPTRTMQTPHKYITRYIIIIYFILHLSPLCFCVRSTTAAAVKG